MDNKKYCIIMAGGIGSRFWPLSTEGQPKQFLDIMGSGKSFIRATFERFLPVVPLENFLVVTSAVYRDQVLEHLPELSPSQVLLEPMRRNTAPCIAYASFRIQALCPEAQVVVTPADHFVLDNREFQRVMELGLDYVSTHDTLLTVGIKPSRSETGYGYIQLGTQAQDEVFNIRSFKEKPSLDLAKEYLLSGDYMWNSGIFLWSNQTILGEFSRQLPDIYSLFSSGSYACDSEQAFIDSIYPDCQSISIDYGVMEGAHSCSVIPADFGWSDIGTWGSLYTHLAKDSHSNGSVGADVVFEDSSNCIVHLPEGDRAVVQGLDGYLVAYRSGKLIVCELEQEQQIKNWIEKF
ncbi:MAG: mannose-1-phosphate guanylyltransferase [Rikenellaceae bacterium]